MAGGRRRRRIAASEQLRDLFCRASRLLVLILGRGMAMASMPPADCSNDSALILQGFGKRQVEFANVASCLSAKDYLTLLRRRFTFRSDADSPRNRIGLSTKTPRSG